MRKYRRHRSFVWWPLGSLLWLNSHALCLNSGSSWVDCLGYNYLLINHFLGLGIPLGGIILVFINRNQLSSTHVLYKYGFLYHGYRQSTYYWEFIIIFKKIVMIFIKVFMATQGRIVQALTSLIFLFISFTANIVMMPFQNDQLNFLESLSLLSSASTIYLGIFFLTNASQTSYLGSKNSHHHFLS